MQKTVSKEDSEPDFSLRSRRAQLTKKFLKLTGTKSSLKSAASEDSKRVCSLKM